MDYYTSWQQQNQYKQQQQKHQELYYQQYQINNLIPIASVRDYSNYTNSNINDQSNQSYPDYYYYAPEPQVPEQRSRKGMYYNYDPVYYQQQQYLNYGNNQYKANHFKNNDYDIILNGATPSPHYENQKYGIHRSYSIPDEEFQQQFSNTNQYYDLHNNNYYYNNTSNQAYNQQYLPSVQPVLYDTPYYAKPYKNKTKLKTQETLLKPALSVESLLDQQNYKYAQQYPKYQDPYFNFTKATKVPLQQYQPQQKYQQIPVVKKEVIPTATATTAQPTKLSDTEKKTNGKSINDNGSSSSSWSNDDKKTPPQKNKDIKSNNLTTSNTDTDKNAHRRPNGLVFIPPDPEKLLKPTLRGAPTGFSNGRILATPPPKTNIITDTLTNSLLTSTTISSTIQASQIDGEFVKKSEVDKLREEVDDLEKQLSVLKKAFSSSKSSSGSTENISLKNVSIKDDDIKKNLEATSKKNVVSSDDETNSGEYSVRSSSVDSSSSSDTNTSSISKKSIGEKKILSKDPKNQKQQIPIQLTQQKPQNKETAYVYQQQQPSTKQVKNMWIPNGNTNTNPYQQQQPYSTNRYDYYEIDPQDPYKSDYTRNIINNGHTRHVDYNGYNYRNEHVYQSAQNHHHHYSQHQNAVPHQHKYNYYNYQPKYSKYQDYPPQRTDQFNQVYNIHGVPLKKADGEKKSKLDKNNNKSQKFANSFVNQQDPKKIFGPSERAIQAETKKKDVGIETKTIENHQKTSSTNKNGKSSKKRYNSDKGSVAGSIFDVPLPNVSDNVSEYSAFVNNVFSKALDK